MFFMKVLILPRQTPDCDGGQEPAGGQSQVGHGGWRRNSPRIPRSAGWGRGLVLSEFSRGAPAPRGDNYGLNDTQPV